MPVLIRCRRPHEASHLSRDFDFARAGGLAGPEDSVALHDVGVFVVTDEAGSRKLMEWREGSFRTHRDAGTWINAVFADPELFVLDGSPLTSASTVRRYNGERWRPNPGTSEDLSSTISHPNSTLAFHARRSAPGMSTCVLYERDSRRLVKKWTAPLVGRPAWIGNRLWLRYEAWPRQRMVALDTDTLEPAEDFLTPVGRLSSLTLSATRSAAIWSTPMVPASLAVAESPQDLLKQVRDAAPIAVPYTWRALEIAGVPVIEHVPLGVATGTVILLHGGPHSVAWPIFSPLIAYLCRHGWRILSPNVRSSALASRFGGQAGDLGIDDVADLTKLAKACQHKGRIILGGWSYGAYVAARAVSMGAPCDGLVALSGFLSPEFITTSPHPRVRAFQQANPLVPTAPAELARVPVLAVHGSLDDRVPFEGQSRFVGSLPRGTVVELNDEGHGVVTDRGAATAYPALLSWLEDV